MIAANTKRSIAVVLFALQSFALFFNFSMIRVIYLIDLHFKELAGNSFGAKDAILCTILATFHNRCNEI
jgi:hypothetical protein